MKSNSEEMVCNLNECHDAVCTNHQLYISQQFARSIKNRFVKGIAMKNEIWQVCCAFITLLSCCGRIFRYSYIDMRITYL